MTKVLITGGGGFMGRNLHDYFKKNKNYDVLSPTKQELNLLDRLAVDDFIKQVDPNIIIHTAITGGMRLEKDSYSTIKDNVEMYENLSYSLHLNYEKQIVIFGSGAEFDRRLSIDKFPENWYNTTYPIDPYGLSKNIITRQALNNSLKIHILRLFNCFNHDEDPSRFIKRCILNIKNNDPIEVCGHKTMDFFYMEDLFTVVDYVLNQPKKQHLNVVYNEKYTLKDIANIILDTVGIKNYPIIGSNVFQYSYTGDGRKLNSLNLNLLGLKEGIARTCKKLL